MAHRHKNLFDACFEGDKNLVVHIISAGTDPRQVRNPYYFEETLLHTACRYVVHVNSPRLQDVNINNIVLVVLLECMNTFSQ